MPATFRNMRRHKKGLVLAVVMGLLVASAAYARSVTLTGALINHYWDFFQFTHFEAEGNWNPDSGDTVTGVILERAPGGTDNFVEVTPDAAYVDGNNHWFAEVDTVHDGQSYHLRGGIKFSPSGGGQGVQYSSKSTALSCEP